MSANAAFDALWAEMLATKFMCQQMFAFLMLANRDKPDWLLKQRVMLLQQADAMNLQGHPNPDEVKGLVRAAIERSIQELMQVQRTWSPTQ